MTYDGVAVLERFAGRAGIGYKLLSDRGSKIIEAFDLLDPGPSKSTPWYGIASPMILAMDADGIVRQRFSTQGYRDRPEVGAVLKAIRDRAGS